MFSQVFVHRSGGLSAVPDRVGRGTIPPPPPFQRGLVGMVGMSHNVNVRSFFLLNVSSIAILDSRFIL